MTRALLLCALVGCEPRDAGPDAPRADAPRAVASVIPSAVASTVTSAPSAVPPIPRMPHEGELLALPVEGWGDAVVAVPSAGAVPRPVLVATHGNYDDPSWQCQEWQRVVGKRAFVLCPRGEPRPDSPNPKDIRFTYASNEKLERELDAALAALATRFAPHVDVKDVVYTGFSLGAIQGTKIAARRPELYPRLVLIEGGYDLWSPDRVRAYAKAGKRVLFVCGQKGCEITGKQAVQLLERAGVAGRTTLVAGGGHSYGGPMNDAILEKFDWLLEGDPRW